jgi:UDP-N-acetylglucosamine 2-epimerase (non-hydrolysing)
MPSLKNLILVVGTRPEAIKMAPIYLALTSSKHFRPILLSTGQQREMLHQALASFGIHVDHNLDLMTSGQTLPDLTAKTVSGVFNFLSNLSAAAVLVQGDTTTVLGSALASFYAKVPVGHVEAGLRTYDMNAPWPEEMNRRLTAPLCRWHFTPTAISRAHLIGENIPPDAIHVTGNTVIDALHLTRKKLAGANWSAKAVGARIGVPDAFRQQFMDHSTHPWLLVTGHRRESFGKNFEQICHALLTIADLFTDLGIIYPVHMNPQVRDPVNRILGNHSRISLVEPASYEDFIWLMERCYFVLSDSGGVQEEAPSLGKPVLVMRDTTERPEGIDAGTCELVGTDPEVIVSAARLLLDNAAEYKRRSLLVNPYGDGMSAQRIVKILEKTCLEV